MSEFAYRNVDDWIISGIICTSSKGKNGNIEGIAQEEDGQGSRTRQQCAKARERQHAAQVILKVERRRQNHQAWRDLLQIHPSRRRKAPMIRGLHEHKKQQPSNQNDEAGENAWT